MQFLILSCNTGEGHNSAAKALKAFFEQQGDSCEIKDALSFWSPEKSKFISRGHVFIYRNLPKLFGISYRFEENHPPKDGNESFMYDLVTRGCESLLEYLNSTNFDAVICTHIFSGMMMTKLRRMNRSNIPCYLIATDYTCSPGFAENDLDGYFIPHEMLRNEFVKNGVPDKKIIASGIPINPAFYSSLSKEEAKRKLHLPADKRIVLLTCGSMGCGPMKALTHDLPELLPCDVRLVVICGNNRRLFKSLTKDAGLFENLSVIGYTKRMPIYMDAASLIITKPGGLSTTEAAAKGLPMIFINAVPGCETHNLDFFVSNGLAATKDSDDGLCRLVCHYLMHQDKLDRISRKLKADFSPFAVKEIYDYITSSDKENT